MGNETSSEAGGAAGSSSSLAQELLRLKAAKAAGWMSEEEFNAEVKRVIREWTGETREPAYDLGEASSPFDVIGDAAQMAEWEARYGRTGDTPASSPEKVHEAAGQRAADGDEDGMVELDLMGGGASPAKTVDPSLDLSFGGAAIEDLGGGGGAETQGGDAAAAGDGARAESTPRLAPPSDQDAFDPDAPVATE